MAVDSPGTTDAFVMATGLPATPADHVYHLWSADAPASMRSGPSRSMAHGTFVAPFGWKSVRSGRGDGHVSSRPAVRSASQGPQVVFGELSNAS